MRGVVDEESALKNFGKYLLLLVVVAVVGSFITFDLGQYLSLEYMKSQQSRFSEFYAQNGAQTVALFMAIYILSTALSLPGAALLTLLGGALFGVVQGTIIVSFASTIGATLAFLGSRFVLRNWVQEKFGQYLKSFNDGVEKDGAFYLFTLRLIPVVPFFVINLVMGLTPMKAITFFWVSQIGMFAGTIVYVNAGTQLSKIESLKGIVSPQILGSFALLGLFPLLAKKGLGFLKSRKALKQYKKPKHYDYNCIAIGAGAAGLVTSYIVAAMKGKVALIEKHKMGGDCLNTGCVPSKALIRSAKFMSDVKKCESLGFKSASVDFDFADVMERVQRVIKTIEPHDSVERYTGLGVDCHEGAATIKSPYEVEVNGKILTTRNIVIGTGARPFVPPIDGVEESGYLTSDTVWDIREKPKNFLVLGGGPIGSELAQAFHRLGCNVTLVELAPRLLIREDPEVSAMVEEKFKNDGLNVLVNHKAVRFYQEGGKKLLECETEGKKISLEYDQVLLSIGRKANVTGFGLEELGVELTDRGTIKVDENLATNFPNIYAAGDVASPYQFTHTAAHEAWFAAVNSFLRPFWSFKVDYSVIPWCTYTDPEVARVGLNETEAKEKGIPYEVSTYGIDDLDRAIADEAAYGEIKVLTVPGKDKILGVTIVGVHAGDIIAEYVAAMKHGFGLNKILGTIHIYPTLAETNKFVAGNWKKASVSEKTLEFSRKLQEFRRIRG